MKRISILLICIVLVFSFTACSQNKNSDGSDADIIPASTDIDAEYESVIAADNISNADKHRLQYQLAQKQLERAENYRILIKAKYKNIIAEYEGTEMYENVGITYDDMCNSVDRYFDSLKNEYEQNKEFFVNHCYAMYGNGNAAASYLAAKSYECAEAYADKAQEFYEDLE